MCGTCGCKSAETLSKTSCCCGADESNPCACMKAPEPMECSAKAPKCACYKALEKNAETFESEYFLPDEQPYKEPIVVQFGNGEKIHLISFWWREYDESFPHLEGGFQPSSGSCGVENRHNVLGISEYNNLTYDDVDCKKCMKRVQSNKEKRDKMREKVRLGAETFEANSDEDNCPVCNEEVYGDMSMIGEEIVPDICGDCDIYVMPQGSDFKVRCIECGYGDFYGSRTPCESCEPIADKMEAVNNGKSAETFDDMKIKYDNRDRIFFIKSVDYDTDGEIENDELPQEFTIKIPSEYHYFDEDADEGDITDVLNEWISTETGFSTKGIVWIEEENNSWRKNAEYDEEDMVYCNHCSDIVGNEKEVYGDETVEYEMANGELVCIPCYKIWMKEYKNDLDPHYTPFYAETFEADPEYEGLNHHGDLPYKVMDKIYKDARKEREYNMNHPKDGSKVPLSRRKDWELIESDTVDDGGELLKVEALYEDKSSRNKFYILNFYFDLTNYTSPFKINPNDKNDYRWDYWKNFNFDPVNPRGYASLIIGDGKEEGRIISSHPFKKLNAETFEAAVIRQGKAPKGAMAKAMMNQSMMEQANIEAMIQELENKVNLGLISEDDLMASLKKKFGAEYDIEVYSSEEMLGSVEVDSNVYYNDNNRYITVSFTDKTGEYEWEGHFIYHNLHHINSNKGLISYDPKTRMAVYDYNGIHWRGQVNFAGKGRHIFSSEEDLEAYFADLKKDNPKLAKIIEFKVKNEEYLPKKLIESSGYDYEILEAWNDYVIDDDKYALFDPCPACEGEGWIMTSYTPATRFEPADGDGEDCGECGGSGKIDPSDYMYYDDNGEIEYAAETKISKICPNCEQKGKSKKDATTDYICDFCAQCKRCCETSYGCYDVAICNDCDGSFIGKDIDGCCGSCDNCCECGD